MRWEVAVVAVAVLVTCCRGDVDHRAFIAPAAVPNMCTADAQCPTGYVCTREGSCIPASFDSEQLRGVSGVLPVGTTIMVSLLAGFIAAALVGLHWMATAGLPPLRSIWSDDHLSLGIRGVCSAAAAGVVVCVLVALPLGMLQQPVSPAVPFTAVTCAHPFDPVCEPYLCNAPAGLCQAACWHDFDCALGFGCNSTEESAAGPSTAPAQCMRFDDLPPRLMPAWVVVCIAASLLFLMLLVFTFLSCMCPTCCPTRLQFNKRVYAGSVVFCVIFAALAFALPMWQHRPAWARISLEGQTVSSVSQPSLPVYGVILTATIIPLVICCCVFGFGMAMAKNGRNGCPTIVLCLSICSCFTFALVFGVPFGVKVNAVRLYDPGDGTNGDNSDLGGTCHGQGECAPYFCNFDYNRCQKKCDRDDECIQGYECTANQCKADPDSGATTVSVNPWISLVVAVSVAVCLGGICGIVAYCISDKNTPQACACFVFGMFFLGICIGVPMGVARTTLPITGSVNVNATCADVRAVVCEPYLCDMDVKQCVTSCKSDDDCIPTTKCDTNTTQCVHDPEYRPSPQPTRKFQAWVVLVGVVVSTVVVCSVAIIISMRCVKVPWFRRQLPAILQDLHTPERRNCPCVSLWNICTVSLTVALVVGLGLGLPRGPAPPLISATSPFVPLPPAITCVNATDCPSFAPVCSNFGCTVGCIAPISGACAPLTCNVDQGGCLLKCTGHPDCIDGYLCSSDGRCLEPIVVPLMSDAWTSFVLAVIWLGGCGFFVVMWAWCCGASCSATRSYGLLKETYTAVLICALLSAWLVGLCLSIPLTDATQQVFPHADAQIPTNPCNTLNAAVCMPYHCDVGAGACAAHCTVDAECTSGYNCRNTFCQPDDGMALRWAIGMSMLFSVVLALVLLFAPAVRRIKQSRLAAMLQRLQEADERERAQLSDKVAQLKLEHPVLLDVTPANKFGRDFTKALLVLENPVFNEDQEMSLLPRNEEEKQWEAESPGFLAMLADVPDDLPVIRNNMVISAPQRRASLMLPGAAIRKAPDEKPDICSICMMDPVTVRLVGRVCPHGFCDSCAEQSLRAILDEGQFPARCPGCRADEPTPSSNRSFIPSETIERLMQRSVISLELCRRFINMQLLQAFDAKEVIACPCCGVLNATPDMEAKERATGKKKLDPSRVECAECHMAFCCKCNNLFLGHRGLSCDDFAKKQKETDAELQTAKFIAATTKKCPSCKMGITHYRGHACHHIRPGTGCPNCGHHFCIVCLKPYPCDYQGHELFCSDTCDCIPCPECKPGSPCRHCDGGDRCPSCQGRVPLQRPDAAAAAPPAVAAGVGVPPPAPNPPAPAPPILPAVYLAPQRGGMAGVPQRGNLAGVPQRGNLAGVPQRGNLAGVPMRARGRGMPHNNRGRGRGRGARGRGARGGGGGVEAVVVNGVPPAPPLRIVVDSDSSS